MKMTADDRLDIFDLFARYTWAYDCGDVDAYAETFTPDGVVEGVGGFRRAQGHDAIRDFARFFLALRGERGWQHYNDHLRIEGDGQQCSVHSYWTVLETSPDKASHHVAATGYYVSQCVKRDGGWYFTHRTVHMAMSKGLPWKQYAS